MPWNLKNTGATYEDNDLKITSKTCSGKKNKLKSDRVANETELLLLVGHKTPEICLM